MSDKHRPILERITQGEWKNHNGVVYAQIGNDEPSFDIFDASVMPGDMNEAFANADLIAAAPAMYRALVRWFTFAMANGWTDADHCTGDIGWITETYNALKQAEGR